MIFENSETKAKTFLNWLLVLQNDTIFDFSVLKVFADADAKPNVFNTCLKLVRILNCKITRCEINRG